MEIDQITEREIHNRQVYITQAVFAFCKKHNIRCFLVGGSLLGAVRYKNILQGDKDVDIGMLREDYERFIALAKELPQDLQLLEPRIDNSYNWLFAKVYQKGTRLIPKGKPLFSIETGIYVDINPYDYVSTDYRKRKKEFKWAKLYKWLLLLKGKPSYYNNRIRVLALLAKFKKRDTLISFFCRSRKQTCVAENIVGGRETDWFFVDEIYNLQEVYLNGCAFWAPVYDRYLNDNYPSWQTNSIIRTDLKEYEVEYE